tara:strand:- start:250 stop:1674 length:1425 start_codon:yes stop_codon:yes gene_type:complete
MDMSSGDMSEPTLTTIPNFIKLEQIPVNYIQKVESDLLEPVVFSDGTATTDGFARFTLQPKGFLHSNSKIFISLEPSEANTNMFLPPQVGIGQVIKKAVLKVGNKTLNELDSWAGLHAVKSSLIANEVNAEREIFMTGRWNSTGFTYNLSNNVNADGITLETGMEPELDNELVELPNWFKHDGSSAAKRAECPSFSIDLSDLFPFLKVNQLPLYMIDEPVNIELHFQPQDLFRLQAGTGDAGGVAVNVNRNELKFCADYIFYGAGDEMERYRQANQDMSFSFVDYRLIERTISKTKLASGVIQNLGMANRVVTRIITVLAPDSTTDNEITLLGQYQAYSPDVTETTGKQVAQTRYNVRYNDRFEFTADIDNPARLMSVFTESEGVPFVTRQAYSDQGTVAGGYSTRIRLDRYQQDEMDGRFFFLGTKLTNGRVGQRGIEVHLTATVSDVDLFRSYCEYMRVARLSNGYLDVFNA